MTQIKLRRDTSSAFASSNPILGNGEPAYETDTKKLKIGDGTTAYTNLEYFSAGGGTTDMTATLPLKIVDGVISLEVDGQTIQIVDGKLHANLDELGNKVNSLTGEVNSLTGDVTDLSGRVTTVESEVANKQDKFNTASPFDIKNVASVSLRDVTVSGDNLLFGNGNLLTGQVSNSISTSSTFAQSIQTGIVIPYKFGQVLQFHCGADTYVQGSNRRHASPCVALFGHFNSTGQFVTALAINGFASYISSDVRGNMGGALKAGAVSMLPNTTYQTTSAESSVERGENTINMGTDYSTYIQLMVNEAGNLMQGIYGHYGSNSTNDAWGAMARTDVIQDRSLDSGQKVADIIAAIDTAVIIKGSNFGTIKKANFGLYNYSERLPWTQSGYDTFIANKGANLIDLDNPSIKPQLQLNIGDGLSVVGGKLTATGGGDVTAAGDNTFTGKNTFSNQIVIPSDFNGVKGICIDGKSTASIYATGDYLNLRNVAQISGGSGSDLVIGTEAQKTQIRGSSVVDKRSKIFLTQGNVTAGDNVTITDTTNGIQISSTGGAGDVTLAGDNTFTGTNLFTRDTLFDGVTSFEGDVWISRLQIGTSLTNEQGKKFLAQGNVTAGDNVTITDTTNGIQISTSDKLEEQLANKLDRSAVKAYVTETYVNGTSWYRVWSDGWCEQGGHYTHNNVEGTITTTFIKPFINTNYNLQITKELGSVSASVTDYQFISSYVASSKTTSRFQVRMTTANILNGYDWQASGYIR